MENSIREDALEGRLALTKDTSPYLSSPFPGEPRLEMRASSVPKVGQLGWGSRAPQMPSFHIGYLLAQKPMAPKTTECIQELFFLKVKLYLSLVSGSRHFLGVVMTAIMSLRLIQSSFQEPDSHGTILLLF